MTKIIPFIFLLAGLSKSIYAQGPMINVYFGQIATLNNKDLPNVNTEVSKPLTSPILTGLRGEFIFIPKDDDAGSDAKPSIGVGALYTFSNTDSLSFAYDDPNQYDYVLKRLKVKTFATEITMRLAVHFNYSESIKPFCGVEIGGIVYKNIFNPADLPPGSEYAELMYVTDHEDRNGYNPITFKKPGVSYFGSGVANIFGGANYQINNIHLLGQAGLKINLRSFDRTVVSTGFQHLAFYLLFGVGIPLSKSEN